jgi:hypothetical protein
LRTFGSTEINADFVSLHLRHPFHPRNQRFPWQLFFLPQAGGNHTEKDFLSASLPRIPWFALL